MDLTVPHRPFTFLFRSCSMAGQSDPLEFRRCPLGTRPLGDAESPLCECCASGARHKGVISVIGGFERWGE
jgi:hypothetical protein